MELSASAVQHSRVFVYVGVKLWEKWGASGDPLCPPLFRQAAFFQIVRERHGLFLDRDLEREREREREIERESERERERQTDGQIYIC